VTPRPKRMLEAAISNAYSSAMRPPSERPMPSWAADSTRAPSASGFAGPATLRPPADDRVPAGTIASRPLPSSARLPPSTDGGVRHAREENCEEGEGRPQGRESARRPAAGSSSTRRWTTFAQGKHGARSTKQAIAIGLSKARRAGVPLKPPRKGAPAAARGGRAAGLRGRPGEAQGEVSVETEESGRLPGLRREPRRAASRKALSTGRRDGPPSGAVRRTPRPAAERRLTAWPGATPRHLVVLSPNARRRR
jgi:hypothetical protein